MEALARHLREGVVGSDADSPPCALALLCDTLGCAGGRDVMQQVRMAS